MNRFVPGEGPAPCNLMFVGEAPGHDENRLGRPFVGKTGLELNRYIRRALSMERSDVYVTNLIKRLPDGDGSPTEVLVSAYEAILEGEICAVDPYIICTLGRWSTRWFLGDVDMDVCHGIPHLDKNGRVIMPVFHPAAGLHNTEMQGQIGWDFSRLRMLIDGNLEVGVGKDEYLEPVYRELPVTGPPLTMADELIAVDTEGYPGHPWGGSFSSLPGKARVFMPGQMEGFMGRVILHNSLHDLGILREMGISIEDGQFDDTMVMAYLLCVEPQGLKQLARRHCGMEMHSYDEIVGPASYKLAADWLVEAWLWLDNQSFDESMPLLKEAPKKTRTRGKDGRK